MKRLEGKVAVITGGTSGIGLAGAKKFVEEGAKVVVTGRNAEKGAKAATEIGENALFYQTNVAKLNDVESMINFAIEQFGTIDILWNNAGTAALSSVIGFNEESYHEVVATDMDGTAFGIVAMANKLKELGKGGVIINTTSVFGLMAFPMNFAYGAAKAAVDNMTKMAASELAPLGIRVVAIAPGTVDTGIMNSPNPFIETLKTYHMHKEIMLPEQIGNAACFLASDEASGINGITVPVDDGWTSFKTTLY